jgi:ribonuclease inhibitor
MATIATEIDLARVASVGELHERLAAAFAFPSYYGANWDAFWDCLRDPGQSSMPAKVVLNGWRDFEGRFPRDAKILKAQIEDARKERPDVQFVVA